MERKAAFWVQSDNPSFEKTLEFLKYLSFFIVLANNVAAGSVSFIKSVQYCYLIS